jgi:hypothetical protein
LCHDWTCGLFLGENCNEKKIFIHENGLGSFAVTSKLGLPRRVHGLDLHGSQAAPMLNQPDQCSLEGRPWRCKYRHPT